MLQSTQKADLYLTQSLLSSWRYFLNAEEAYSDSAYQSFLSALRREKTELTKAMLEGIAFEDMINATVRGYDPMQAVEIPPKWEKAVKKFSRICAGGQSQTPVSGILHAHGLDIGVYGLCDYVKAGVIYDIKKVTRYEYGKYYSSPQHPMYMRLLPEAKKFTYLIFDGAHTYMETYRSGDFPPIEFTVSEFLWWLKEMDLFEEYKNYWTMNDERIEKVYGTQI